mgnify:FL=1
MPSPLSFNSTENFRKKLLVKNLPPFNSDGFAPSTNPGQSELILSNYAVVDSAEVEDIGDVEEVKLFLQNQYGPAGGYDDRYTVQDVQKLVTTRETYYKFVSSSYTSASILLNDDPQGTNGSLTQDSAMIQIGAKSLKDEFQYRVNEEIRQETLGRANFLNALKDPFIAADILTGRQELIEPDWTISSPTNIIGKGLDFLSRITGVYVPFSWIPGDYFEGKRVFSNIAVNKVSNFFGGGKLLPERKSGSDIFLNNTGGGQTSTMFKSLEYNRFRPDYKANFISDLNLRAPNGNYYVGKRTQDPNDIIAPPNELPVDMDGNRVQTAVRGYGELATLYEGNQFKFGLNTVEPGDSPDIQGGFTWVSPDSRKAAGKNVGVGGDIKDSDPGFQPISSQFESSSSTGFKLTEGSILDDTQRLIDAADGLQGQARLSHVGTAINQVSKVFFDGTREITKGSRVKRYVNENGAFVGEEYCRVFTKDTPYYTMADLQKRDGNIRKFTNSVLDNTYNLNIAPQKSGGVPTNFGTKNGENITKYMLSLENLAWRTSNMTQDLAECEKGPNGGRVMWFPPYNLSVDESVSASWTSNDFLGRPEPIYTYSNTQRQGSISFKILVDHPSVLNTLVDKELANVTPDSQVTKIVDSFFSGCKTMDIYELARKYGQLSFNDIYEVVSKTNNPDVFRESFKEVPRQNPEPDNVETTTPQKPDFSEFEGTKLYFHNDKPDSKSRGVTSSVPYDTTYNNYLALESEYLIQSDSIGQKQQVQTFFDTNIKVGKTQLDSLIDKLVDAATNKYRATIKLTGSASSPNDKSYNLNLSKRRVDSVEQQILNDSRIKKLNQNGLIGVVRDFTGEETTIDGVDCSKKITNEVAKTYSIDAMACRRTTIKSIEIIAPPIEDQEPTDEEIVKVDTVFDKVPVIEKGKGAPRTTDEIAIREGITKKVLRKLLSECDYFEAMSEDTSFLYEGIKEKIKYFNPSFHSMTPEGLNTRLTFLQQCMRPGDTIPTIGPDGQPLENNALNTSFGSPPICVLRVGDFFHTKIAINQMSIRYDPLVLDLNPEGIGVQPMIADVTLSFYFIGGHGLKGPVDRLQNALSFNYYANTEMYDERSVATEDTSSIDLETIEALGPEVPFSINDISGEDLKDGGTTIGEITSKQLSNSGTSISGVINYKSIMNDLSVKYETYRDSVGPTLQCIAESYGEIGLRMFTKDRSFINGDITIDNTKIFGKSEKITDKIQYQFSESLKDVDNDVHPLQYAELTKTFSSSNSFKNKDVKKYDRKLKEIINGLQSGFESEMTVDLQTLTSYETELTRVIDKMNIINEEFDGFIQSDETVIYDLTATTEVYPSTSYTDTLDELRGDLKIISDKLNELYDITETKVYTVNGNGFEILSPETSNTVYQEDLSMTIMVSDFANAPSKRYYLIFYRYILNDSVTLINELTNFVNENNFTNSEKWVTAITNNINNGLKDFQKAQSEISKLFEAYENKVESTSEFKDIPYTKDKVREFTFTNNPTPPSSDTEQIQKLYSGNNEGDATKWNNKVKLQ